MALEYPNWVPPNPSNMNVDVVGSFARGFDYTKGLRQEQEGLAAFDAYANSLYGPQGTTPQSLAAMAPQFYGPASAATSTVPANPASAYNTGADALINGSHTAAARAGETVPFELTSYLNSIRAAESGGNDAAKNPKSSATGRYQFTEGTWNDLMQNNPQLGLTPDGRTDPMQQEKAIQVFTQGNASQLSSAGIQVNPGNLYAAHFLGGNGATSVLGQQDNAPLMAFVGPEVIQANPFLADMTVGDFRAWANEKGGNGNGGYQAPANPAGFPSPTGVPNSLPPREVMQALFRSPDTRPLAIALAQAAQNGQQIAQVQTFVRPDGTVMQMNTQTGEMSVVQAGPDPVKPALPTDDMREYEIAKTQGFTGTLMDFIKAGKATGQTINVNTGEGADGALNKALSEAEGKQWADYKAAGTVSASNAQDFAVLDELIQIAPQGPLTGRLAEWFPGTSSAGDAFQSIVKRIAPTLRAPGSGATSDIEYDGMLRSLPALRNTPEANQMITTIMKSKAALNVQRSEIITQYQSGDIGVTEARRQMNELDRVSIITPEMRNALTGIGASAPTAPSTTGDAPPAPAGVDPALWSVMTPEERALWQ